MESLQLYIYICPIIIKLLYNMLNRAINLVIKFVVLLILLLLLFNVIRYTIVEYNEYEQEQKMQKILYDRFLR